MEKEILKVASKAVKEARESKYWIELLKETDNILDDMVDNYLIFFNGDDNYELVAEDEEILDEDLYGLFVKGFKS